MNSHLRCSKTLWQTLNAANVVGVNVIAVIWAGGGEGHIIQDDLAYISEIIQQTRTHLRPTKKAFQNSRFKTPSR